MSKTQFWLLIFTLLTLSSGANAAKKAGWSMGLNIGIINADQKDMNGIIEKTDADENTTVSKLGNSWEGAFHLAYRFPSVSILFRPSYIYNVEDGTDGSGRTYEYSANGITFFPILRFHLLENNSIKFFANLGVGFGWVHGEIKEQDKVIEYSGNDFGYLGGLGAEFCFWQNHCLNVEGNMRFLNVDRTTVTSVSGSYANDHITQDAKGSELEVAGRDFGVSLSGVQAFIGYSFYF